MLKAERNGSFDKKQKRLVGVCFRDATFVLLFTLLRVVPVPRLVNETDVDKLSLLTKMGA